MSSHLLDTAVRVTVRHCSGRGTDDVCVWGLCNHQTGAVLVPYAVSARSTVSVDGGPFLRVEHVRASGGYAEVYLGGVGGE